MDNKDNSYSKVNKVTKGKTTISKIQNDIIENKINELNIKCENIAKENEEIKKLIQTKVIDLSKIYHNFSKININKGKDKKNNTKAYTNVQTEVNQEKEYKKDKCGKFLFNSYNVINNYLKTTKIKSIKDNF